MNFNNVDFGTTSPHTIPKNTEVKNDELRQAVHDEAGPGEEKEGHGHARKRETSWKVQFPTRQRIYIYIICLVRYG